MINYKTLGDPFDSNYGNYYLITFCNEELNELKYVGFSNKNHNPGEIDSIFGEVMIFGNLQHKKTDFEYTKPIHVTPFNAVLFDTIEAVRHFLYMCGFINNSSYVIKQVKDLFRICYKLELSRNKITTRKLWLLKENNKKLVPKFSYNIFSFSDNETFYFDAETEYNEYKENLAKLKAKAINNLHNLLIDVYKIKCE